jgi:hypothetical protein
MNRYTELRILEEGMRQLRGVEQSMARHRLEIAKTMNDNGQDCEVLINEVRDILHGNHK